MSTKILFEITEKDLETGLRGFPVGFCTTSRVDPMLGLFYRDKPIVELASYEPEQVIRFLLEGQLEKNEGYFAFLKDLQGRSHIDSRVREYILKLPRHAHPMKLFEMALLILGSFEGTGSYREDTLNLVAKLPKLVALIINHHAGWSGELHSRPELGYMENFVSMLHIPDLKSKKNLIEIMRLFNILHYDHGGGNLSTFVGKAVASGLEDLYGSIAASMCALEGPRHGKANQDCLVFVEEVLNEVGADATADQVEALVRSRLETKKLVYGFGHAVLRVEDPRATLFYSYVQEHFREHPLVKMGLHLRDRGTKVLKENEKINNPYPNVDAVSGIALSVAGFPYPEYFTLLFGLARAVGISRQIVYEREEARGGRGLPIVRPKYIYRKTS